MCLSYLFNIGKSIPGIVMYASTHNSSGWGDSDNPVRLGSGIHGTWAWRPQNNVIAKQADQIVDQSITVSDDMTVNVQLKTYFLLFYTVYYFGY